jgi:hypothetical protein
LQRAGICQLYSKRRNVVLSKGLSEFIQYGIRHTFPAPRGPLVRGVPTAYAAEPLRSLLSSQPVDWSPVWPDPLGTDRGYELEPLYSSASRVVLNHSGFYEVLALVDAIREGRARERSLAMRELNPRFAVYQEKLREMDQT